MSKFDHPNSTPSSFRTKLGSYATGLAIGFLLLGFFMYQKNRSQQRDSARIEQLQEQGREALNGSTP